MIFRVSGSAYDRFMGRYATRLAPAFADFAAVVPGERVLDVGAGTGALTTEVAARVGEAGVAAAEPSTQFVAALRARLPEADVREAPAEQLPWPDESFDTVMAQLVVSFVADAPAAAAEMHRVVRSGGSVAICMWEEGGLELRRVFQAARGAVAPGMPGPRPLAYRTEGELRELLLGAGLAEPRATRLEVQSEYSGAEEFLDVAFVMRGPDTAWLAELDAEQWQAVRDAVQRRLGSPEGPFTFARAPWR